MLLKQNLMAYLIYNKVARLEAKTKILAEMWVIKFVFYIDINIINIIQTNLREGS